MVFKPGQSGNPGGVHKSTRAIKELSREFSVEIIREFMEIVRDKTEKGAVRVAAGNAILDRAHGKPTAVMGEDGELAPVYLIHTGIARQQEVKE